MLRHTMVRATYNYKHDGWRDLESGMLDMNVDANAGADAKRWTWQIFKDAKSAGHFLPRPPRRFPF